MDRRDELKREYKENPPAAGVYRVLNTANGKQFIGSARDLRGKLNGQRFQLERGGHPNEVLQAEWRQFGAAAFTFEVLDELKPAPNERTVDLKELAALEALWMEKLRPYGERGYHREQERQG
jgi:hypothetical protein